MSSTQQIADDQVTGWGMDDDRHTLFYSFAALVLGFAMILFVRGLVRWYRE